MVTTARQSIMHDVAGACLRNDSKALPCIKRHWKLMCGSNGVHDRSRELRVDRFMHGDITFTMLGDAQADVSDLHVKCMSHVETQCMSV